MNRILALFCLFASLQCEAKRKVPRHIQKKFSVCYSGQTIPIRALIDIDGYYSMQRSVDSTSTVKMQFFDDGIFQVQCGTCDRDFSVKFFDCGLFRISGDTIIVEHLFDLGSSIRVEWHALQEKFKVIDRQTIVRIDAKYLSHQVQSKYETNYWNDAILRQKPSPARFISNCRNVSTKCWIKEEDWIRCKP